MYQRQSLDVLSVEGAGALAVIDGLSSETALRSLIEVDRAVGQLADSSEVSLEVAEAADVKIPEICSPSDRVICRKNLSGMIMAWWGQAPQQIRKPVCPRGNHHKRIDMDPGIDPGFQPLMAHLSSLY